jgi:hypothetical protein
MRDKPWSAQVKRSASNTRSKVGWMPCDCASALAAEGFGHLWVRCRAPGCSSIWYRPPHQSPG